MKLKSYVHMSKYAVKIFSDLFPPTVQVRGRGTWNCRFSEDFGQFMGILVLFWQELGSSNWQFGNPDTGRGIK